MKKPALIIGQAQRQETRDTPFIKSNLWKWFETIGCSQTEIMKFFQFDALVNHGTTKGKKGRVPPTSLQIKTYLPELIKKIDVQKPKLVVPVGNLAIRYLFNDPGVLLEQVIGEKFMMCPFGMCKKETLVIPLPHPSGVSLWLNSVSNKKRLNTALALLKQEIEKQ